MKSKSIPELTSKYSWEQKLEDGTEVKIKPLFEEYWPYYDNKTNSRASEETLPEDKIRAKNSVWFLVSIWEKSYHIDTKEYGKVSIRDNSDSAGRYFCTTDVSISSAPIPMKTEEQYAVFASILEAFTTYEDKHVEGSRENVADIINN